MDTLDERFDMATSSKSTAPSRSRLGSLLPTFIDASRPEVMQGVFSFGALADSYYEYLIKQAQLLGNAHPQYARMYEDAIESAYEHLVSKIDVVPDRDDLVNIGVRQWGQYSHTLEHLTCFAGGMLGLGAKLLGREDDLDIAQNVSSVQERPGGLALTLTDDSTPTPVFGRMSPRRAD